MDCRGMDRGWGYHGTKDRRVYIMPEPPSGNLYWRIFNNRAVKTKEARAYCDRAYWLRLAGQPYSGAVVVTIHWYRSRKAGDLDNRAKVVLDALQGVAYVKDSQITELHMYRLDTPNRYGVKGTMDVTVTELSA